MSRPPTLREHIVEQCRKEAQARLKKGIVRFPTLAKIATMYGCSHITAKRAVNRLVDEGILRSQPGAGIHIATGGPPPPTGRRRTGEGQSVKPRWRRVAMELVQRWFNNPLLNATALPPRKQLCSTFGVSLPTLNKALNFLASRGILSITGTTCRFTHSGNTTAQSAIVFVYRGQQVLRAENLSIYQRQVWNALERECSLHHIHFVPLPLYYDSPTSIVSAHKLAANLQHALKGKIVIGYIVWNFAFGAYDPEPLLALLKKDGVPVSIIEESEPPFDEALLASSPPMRIFRHTDDFMAGRSVGTFLRRENLTRCACITFDKRPGWQTTRIDGVKSILELAGERPPPTHYLVNKGIWHRYASFSEKDIVRVAQTILSPSDYPFDPTLLSPRLLEKLKFDTASFGNLWIRIHDLQRIVEKIMEDRPHAIVCSNDLLATATTFLLDKINVDNIPPPVIVSFDGTEDSILFQYSSFDFNYEGLVKAAFEFTLRPQTYTTLTPGNVTVVEGMLRIRMVARH